MADEATGGAVRAADVGICIAGEGILIGGLCIFIGGAGVAAGVLAGGADMEIPSPWLPNGLPISSVNSTCFCIPRRASSAGFNRARISFNGSITGLWSFSPPELTNMPGAACRNSPKVIFTAPRASWMRTFSSETEMTISAGGVCMTFARSSIGSAAIMGCKGNCSSLPAGTGRGAGAVIVIGGVATGGGGIGAPAEGANRGVSGAAASLSSKRRSKPRSTPAIFVFTVFDMIACITGNPPDDRCAGWPSFSTKRAIANFFRLCHPKTGRNGEGTGYLSQRWTGLSLVGSRSGAKLLLLPCLNLGTAIASLEMACVAGGFRACICPAAALAINAVGMENGNTP